LGPISTRHGIWPTFSIEWPVQREVSIDVVRALRRAPALVIRFNNDGRISSVDAVCCDLSHIFCSSPTQMDMSGEALPSAGATPTQSKSRARQYALASVALLLGALFGLGAFTFGYGEGWVYLSNNPRACTNCHVMQGHFDSWENSGHRHVAVCADCHLPQDAIGKLVTEADNGFCHSLAFTLENFHEPIQIKPRNARVTQNACLHCHSDFVHEITAVSTEQFSCVHCHRDAGHALR